MPSIPDNKSPDNTKIFTALCEARCARFGAGELTLQETVDSLQEFAVQKGLVKAIGQDAVQAIMAHAMAPYRTDLVPPPVD